MTWKDIDHNILERAFAAKSGTELEMIAAECGYGFSAPILEGTCAAEPCQRKVCYDFTQL